MTGELPDDVKATLSILDQPQTPTTAKLKTTRTMDDIALPIRAPRADDVEQTLSILDGNQPDNTAQGEPDKRDIEADVLKLALRRGVNSNTALAAHRKAVAQKIGVSPALVTPQAEEKAFYQEHDPVDLQKNYPALAKYLKVEGNAELVGKDIDPLKGVETFYRRAVQDPEIMLAKGVIGAVSTVVGLGDLVSAGKAGKYVEEKGLDLKKIQSVLTDLYTPEAQAAARSVAEAKGFWGTLEAAAANPSAVGLMIGESLPQMYLGRVFGGALKAAFPSISFGVAGAGGEGITMAGGSAEQIRRESDNGELSGKQTALALGVGVLGTGLSAAGSKIVARLGIEDVDTALVAGKLLTRLEDSGMPKQLAVRLIGGAAVEGGIEEMPQSIVEQIAQNVALNRPWDEGVPENAAIGLVTGGAMGAAVQVGAVRGKAPIAETPAEKQARTTVQNSILRTAAAVNAEEQRNALKEWGKRISQDVTLRKESPESFKEFVRTMADEDGAVKEVFVEAKLLSETLAQAGISKDKLAEDMPEVAASLSEALDTNGEVRIPIEDYATHIVGTLVESAIIDHLRTTPDGMTYAESQTFFQQQQDDFIKQAETLVNINEPVLTRKEFAAQAPEGVQYKDYLAAHKNKVEVFANDLQEVHDKLLAGLESTGRFPGSINKVYAIPFREFYAVNAARMGILPSELYNSLPLNFEKISANDILNQRAFHGSPHSFDKFSTGNIGTGEGAQAYGYGLYFTDTKAVAEHYRQAHKNNKLILPDGTDLKEAANGTEEKFAQTLLKANSGDYAKSLTENKVSENASPGDKRFAKAVEKVLKDYKKQGVKAVSLSGGIYEVELAPKEDEYLLWDKPLSAQSDKVKNALRDYAELKPSVNIPDTASGSDIYNMFVKQNVKRESAGGVTTLDYNKAQKPASAMLHFLGIRGIKYLDQGSRGAGKGSYNYVVFSDADVAIKQVYGQASRQPINEPLIALHNITSQNLINVDKQGGFAAPSLAVTHADKALTSFGDITLLAEKGMVDPRYGAKVFGADVYSTRYPSVDYKFSKNAIDRLNSQLKTYYETLNISPIESYTLDTSSREVDNELKNNPAVMAAFLETKGIKPRYVKMKKRPIAKWALKYAEQKMYSYIDTEAFREDVRKHTERVEEILSRAKTEEEERTMLRRIADGKAYEIDAYHRDRELFGKVDPTASASSLNSQIVLKKLSDDFATYRSNLVQGLHPEERIFKGYTTAGNRRYVPHTIDEVIKIMKQGIRAGEGTLFGSGVLRAAHTPQFKSIEQIRKNAGKIVTHEEFENIKTEIDNEFMSVADDLNRYLTYKPDSFYSAAMQAVIDSKSMGLNRALTENQFKNVPPEAQQRLADFITKLENLPTEYFEVKLIRRVELGEFAAAVVPKNVSPEALNILKKNGVTDIRFYKTGDNTDRQAKVNEFNDLFFQSAFYSALQKEIPSIQNIAGKDGTLKPDQAKAWIEARQKEGKFKKEEVEAVGLLDWLDAQEGKVSVADIENFVKENGVQIEETLLGEPQDGTNSEPAFYEYDPESDNYAVYSYRIDSTEYYDSEPEAANRVEELNAGVPSGETKFENYVLPGGTNYRELLLTLPGRGGQTFKSSHFDQPNILAHVRVDERTVGDQRVLFVEEIQSDWAQQGRDKGFKTSEYEKYSAELRNKYDKEYGAYNYNFGNVISDEERNTLKRLSSQKKEGVVRGPFVQNTKSWTALAVKRLLRYAAENGFDKIAWTTGEQQAARYDLSKQISEVHYSGTNLKAYDYDGNTVINQTGVREEDLPDYIGKEAAQKLIDQPKRGTLRSLEGVDLKIGGEGMKAFYDQIVPQVVNEVSKKLGGGKVGATEIPFGESDPSAENFVYWAKRRPGNELTRNELYSKWARGYDDPLVTEYMKAEVISEQHSLDITPEMRDKIMQGLPLFQGQRAGFDPSTFTMSLLKGADLSSVVHEGAHFYLEALADLAGRDTAPKQIKDDFRTTLEWFGITGNEVGVPGGSLLDQRAFHGSPHDHNKFDSANIGTGEGAQAYGYGHYFADSKDVAEYYKQTLENVKPATYSINGKKVDIPNNDWRLMYLQSAADNTLHDHIASLEEANATHKDDGLEKEIEYAKYLEGKDVAVTESDKVKGKLYEVELAPEQDEYLLWDKPLSEQSEKVKAALGKLPKGKANPDGLDMGGAVIRDNRNGQIKPDSVYPWVLVSGDSKFDLTQKDVDRMLADNREKSTGENIYSRLTSLKGSQKAASEYLHSLGIRGIKYLDGSSRAKGEGAYNYVIFDDKDIEIVNKYAQGGETPPPGQLPPGRTPEEIWNSMTLDQKRQYHEQWAQSYERYTLEGKAPTVEMQSVFSRFREWMLSVYKSMKDFLAQNPLAGKLNDDIRGVFDRLIASEEKIYQAEEARGYTALFASAAEAGLSEAEYEDYINLGKLASARALDEMQGRSIRDMRWLSNAKDRTIKRLQAEANSKRAAIAKQVADEVDDMPLNRARNFLTKGEFIDESGVRRESETKFKLNEAEVKALTNGQTPANIKNMVAPDGIGLELAAKLLGFQSPETLVDELVNGESRDVTIQGLTDQRMLEQYGDLTDDKEIERAAEKAIHNDARARFMATGLKLLSKTGLSVAQLNRAAKMAAETAIGKKKIRAITPGQFTRAEAKANREALENVARDPKKALDAQRAALLNNRLAKAALEAAEDVDSILKYFKKFESKGVRKAVGIDQIDQIDDLLQSVDRDKNLPLREIDKRQALADWVAEQEADGFEPVLDPVLAEQIKTKHYKDMTITELRNLRDTVKQIEHVGRLKQTLLTEMGRADFRTRVEEAENSIRENANRTVEERATPTDTIGIAGQWVRQMLASHRKFNSFLREMDGGRDGGVMWRLLAKQMNAAGDNEVEMRRASSEAVSNLFKGFKQDKTPLNLYAKRTRIPGTDIAMAQEQRIMFGMNWGNEGNRQRLLDGGIAGKRALSVNEANAILDTLTKEEWDFIQGTWDHIATYKDQIAALERKITGIEPEWIAPAEIKTKYGTYRGGYFPAKYDTELSTRSESLEAAVDLRMGMKGAFNAAAARNGYTKQRSEAVMNRPLMLSYNVIANHISEVTHRLAWQPWLIDANRLLKALDAPIRQHYGAEVLREMRNTITDIAAGDVGARGAMERAINHLRTGSTIVGMGWRFSTAFLQPSGLAQSWARIGGRWMAKGIAETFKNLNSAGELVNRKSSLMKNRDITMNREVRDVLDRVRTTDGLNAVTGSYFSLIGKMQRVVDIPTWLGAYEKALHDLKLENATTAEERARIDSDAVALADQAVIDSQSGGQLKDLASIQRGSPALKLFTNFYSYFSATYNLNIEALRRTNFRSPTDVAVLAGDMVLLNIVPVIFALALKEMTKGKCGDDMECLVKSYGYEQLGYMFGQVVLLRDMGSAALVAAGGDQYGYSGPAGLRFFSDLYKAGVQVNQGELDWPLFKSISNTTGVLLHFPTGQVNTTLEGIMAVENGDVEGVSILPALLFGPPKDN